MKMYDPYSQTHNSNNIVLNVKHIKKNIKEFRLIHFLKI